MEKPTESHPVVKFEQIPIVEGPLSRLMSARPRILQDVVSQSMAELSGGPLDLTLSEALHAERQRMMRERVNLFTQVRRKGDLRLWGNVQSGLLQSGAMVDRKVLLERVLAHYANEIGGRFDPRVYWFATRSVPWFFSWLLNAATVRRFLPWGMTESLASRLKIVGEIPALQRLSKKGTILLVPTHQSNIDSVLIGYVIYLMSMPPFAYGAGLNLFSNPLLGFLMSHLGAYTVDRQKSHPIYKQVLKNYSTRILREGIHSIFFPGGGRSRSGAIESRVKLGLLGTGLEAQLKNLQDGRAHPNVYVVPMVMSYHFVLEARSLIEDYLVEFGKHRYIITDDESFQAGKVLNFFWRFFSSQSGVTVRIGRPLDIFGNFVDDEGRSMGPNGTTIDPRQWLTSRGELRPDAQRDHEYTRVLGNRLAERFHCENTVLTSHAVAFAFFETLRRQYPDLDLYRFLRLTAEQRTIPLEKFLAEAERIVARLREMSARGMLYLDPMLASGGVRDWIRDGIRNLGVIHDVAVIRMSDDDVATEDMSLLYYYRNRLAGYGLSLLADTVEAKKTGQIYLGRERERDYDPKGFLA